VEKPSAEESSGILTFWFDLNPDGWSYGLGYYAASATTMEKLRARIDDNPQEFEKLIDLLGRQNEFQLDGPAYVRQKPAPTPKTQEWYNKKSFSLIHFGQISNELFSRNLADRLVGGYRFLMPFYDYFTAVENNSRVLTIRPAEITDYAGIERFYCDMINSMRNTKFKPEWEMGVYPTEQILKDAIRKQTLFLTHLGSELVGVMVLNHECESEYENVKWQKHLPKNEVMFIHLLGVSPFYNGKGFAKQMVAYAVKLCREKALKAIRLDVLKKNIPAMKLYESTGFQFIESRKMYYEDTGLTDFHLYELIL
jgi:ribosomal protein S18 acetylase RimI-like enzyme